MALDWIAPREWITGEPITKEKLNEISNDLNYLMQKPSVQVTVRGNRSNITTSSGTPVELDPAVFTVLLEISGNADLSADFSGTFSNALSTAYTAFDILIDGTTYLSSLTTTALTRGVQSIVTGTNGLVVPVKMEVLIPVGTLTAGVHKFVPMWWVSGNTATFYEAAGYFAQFHVGEV